MNAVSVSWKRFVEAIQDFRNFSGTTSREEFVSVFLVYLIAQIVLIGLPSLFEGPDQKTLQTGLLVAWITFSIATLVAGAAVTVRRLRDAGTSPWWVVIPPVSLAAVIAISLMGILNQTVLKVLVAASLLSFFYPLVICVFKGSRTTNSKRDEKKL